MGELVRDRYEALAVLGEGADSEVVQAIDRQHDRLVALKLRRVDAGRRPGCPAAEGRALLGLRPHPAIPTVRDDFFLDDCYVLVMDWIDGTHLDRIVASAAIPGLPSPPSWAGSPPWRGALDHLHQHQPRVIHGDVRPENIIITPDGRPTSVFGAATLGSSAGGSSNADADADASSPIALPS